MAVPSRARAGSGWAPPLREETDGTLFPFVVELWTPPLPPKPRGTPSRTAREWTPIVGVLVETLARDIRTGLERRNPHLTYRVRDVRAPAARNRVVGAAGRRIDLTGETG